MYVHVGLPKTGTTHLQLTLAANRERLAEQGFRYPRVGRGEQHFHAVLDFLRMPFGAVELADVAGAWDALREAVNGSSGRAVISHELLAGATSSDVGRLVEQFAPAPVHAVVSVRDMSRLLPAVWQERAKNGMVERWPQFRTAVFRGPDAADAHPFWNLHDAERVITTWAAHVPADRVHVVTVPADRAEQHLLVSRFGAALGADVGDFTVAEDPANASIGALELAVLRAVNAASRGRLDRAAYTLRVKRFLVPKVLAKRPGQVRLTIPESERGWLEDYTATLSARLAGGGFDVSGTTDDLTPTNFAPDSPSDPAQTGHFPPAVVATALAEVLVDVLARQQHARKTAAAPAPVGQEPMAARMRRAVRQRVRRPGR